MKCFNHPEIDAVALCKHCSKGLCIDCSIDLGHGVACKGIHEEQVESVNALIERNKKVCAAQPKNLWIMPMFYLFLGIIFAGMGVYKSKSLVSFPVLMGSGFIFFGAIIFIRNREIYKNGSKI